MLSRVGFGRRRISSSNRWRADTHASRDGVAERNLAAGSARPESGIQRIKSRGAFTEQLPNLAAGTQQILIARYLPQGEDQRGEIVVTGKRGDQTVRFSAPISLLDAEAGNSFIPRLWARSHLDHLLSQGSSQLIADQIIALSEEFHIITPYTSLLVLESDADRERFGVKRRFEMRDGERFFAEGRSNADFELLQQQMKRAGDWRLALRRRILSQLTELGRDTQVLCRCNTIGTIRCRCQARPARPIRSAASQALVAVALAGVVVDA